MFIKSKLMWLALLSFSGAASAGVIQKPGLSVPASAAQNAEFVRSQFVSAYETYRCVPAPIIRMRSIHSDRFVVSC